MSPFAYDLDSWIRRNGRVPSLATRAKTLLLTPGLHFVGARRLIEALRRIPILGPPLALLTWVVVANLSRCEIALDAKLGPGVYIPHPYGIVIGKCTIGRNVTILQNVTIGSADQTIRSEPMVEDDVFIGAGAVILGDIRIGAGSSIGANAVVICDVPERSIAVGVPAKIKAGRKSQEA